VPHNWFYYRTFEFYFTDVTDIIRGEIGIVPKHIEVETYSYWLNIASFKYMRKSEFIGEQIQIPVVQNFTSLSNFNFRHYFAFSGWSDFCIVPFYIGPILRGKPYTVKVKYCSVLYYDFVQRTLDLILSPYNVAIYNDPAAYYLPTEVPTLMSLLDMDQADSLYSLRQKFSRKKQELINRLKRELNIAQSIIMDFFDVSKKFPQYTFRIRFLHALPCSRNLSKLQLWFSNPVAIITEADYDIDLIAEKLI
jgi:hypothetical protein